MVLFFTFVLISSFMLFVSIYEFIREKERLAVLKVSAVFIVLILFSMIIISMNSRTIYILTNTFFTSIALLLLLPIRSKKRHLSYNKLFKHDERDIMFSRNELKPGSKDYIAYYKQNPQHVQTDNLFRKEPGLLSDQALFYHKEAFEAARGIFETIKKYHNQVDGEIATQKSVSDPLNLYKQLKAEAIKLGALDVGITPLSSYHFYSHKGRGEEYGNPIQSMHTFAIVFTVEMDYSMVQAAPKASIVLESANQYLNSAKIATMLANSIRENGYSARAHIDGNYQVICPLVAKDAGLGEIGRMGLLMTPTHGPRVRIGVVTTDLPLQVDKKISDQSIEQFCLYCKKCAVCCPSQSISLVQPSENNGSIKWTLNSESCFTYWCKIGTDCGRCMAVCPYSHPDTSFHKLVRWGIRNNWLFMRLAIYLDDFFYGRKPKPKKMPEPFKL